MTPLTRIVPVAVMLIFCAAARGQLPVGPSEAAPPSTAPSAIRHPPSAVARPTTVVAQEGCVTSDCHANIKGNKIVHGPVNVNACDACHQLRDAKAHTFAMWRSKTELCTYCHEFQGDRMPVVHKPVAAGECLGCHDPHGGDDSSLVRERSTIELCGRCHEGVTEGKHFAHTPVARGECLTCHPPHGSRYPKLLDFIGTDLCLACHVDFDQRLAKVKFTHKALEKGCLACHEAHASDNPMTVRKPVVALCLGCHETLKDSIALARFTHPAATEGRACMTCHTAHGSDLAKLLAAPQETVCMECHREPIKTKRGYVVAAAGDLVDPKMIRHGATRDGQCGGCHAVHGGNRPLLLAKAYSANLYQRFSPEQFELCWGCHDLRLVQEEKTRDATGFRNGDLNLHNVHIKGRWLGRNCRVCHGAHGSLNPGNIHDGVQLKEWRVPIRFTRTATGGECTSGCHKAFAYDRDKPVPGMRPPPDRPAMARVEPQPPPRIKWLARDTAGRPVSVPDANRPSVVLLLRAEECEPLLKSFTAIAPDADRAQIVVVLCGPRAKAQIKTLAKRQPVAWPLVDDTDFVHSRSLGVIGWPTVLIVRRDGVEAARLGGAGESLALKLDPYIDFAANAIDRQTLAQRTGSPGVVGDGPARDAAHRLQLAQKLTEENKVQQALALLTESLRDHPDSAPLRAGMIRALTALGRGQEALDMLNKLPDEALPPGRAQVLRARALIALGNWSQAQTALANALKAPANLPEAHYLMGVIFEHEGNWEAAAREYRAAHDAGGK